MLLLTFPLNHCSIVIVAIVVAVGAVIAADVTHLSSEFGVDNSKVNFDFWHWDRSFLDWTKNCKNFNRSGYPMDGVQTRITGGTTAEPDMFPYQAGLLLLQRPKIYQCGGALISRHHVLTAAHCLYKSTLGKVYLGSIDFASDNSAAVYNVSSADFLIHERYVSNGGVDDIALVYLSRPVPLSRSVQPIPLARRFMTQEMLEDEVVTTSGWGLTSDKSQFPNLELYYLEAPVLPMNECACYFLPGLVRQQNHICTDGSDGRGSCDGDSGGPLTFIYKDVNYLVGLTSFGSAGGCEIGFPSVFTRITSYRDWIERHTRRRFL